MKKEPCAPQVGADIEVFLYSTEAYSIVPCVGIIEGTKDKPYRPDGFREGFALQEDNVMLEYNVPPARNANEFYENMNVARNMITQEIPRGHSYLVQAEHDFAPEELESPQAQLIGCEPDHDAYAGGEQRAYNGSLGTKRTCGGHIHLGGDFKCPDFVAALFSDLCLGVYRNIKPVRDNSRTEWYGRPGIFRPKPYGMEYRTPDNLWTGDMNQVYEVAAQAIQLARWLTENDAEIIRRTFVKINWQRIRDYMLPSEIDNKLRAQIIKQARTAGAPLT